MSLRNRRSLYRHPAVQALVSDKSKSLKCQTVRNQTLPLLVPASSESEMLSQRGRFSGLLLWNRLQSYTAYRLHYHFHRGHRTTFADKKNRWKSQKFRPVHTVPLSAEKRFRCRARRQSLPAVPESGCLALQAGKSTSGRPVQLRQSAWHLLFPA